jgi:hypothetical protein
VRIDMAKHRGDGEKTRVDAHALSLWVGIGVGVIAIVAALSATFNQVAGTDRPRLNFVRTSLPRPERQHVFRRDEWQGTSTDRCTRSRDERSGQVGPREFCGRPWSHRS